MNDETPRPLSLVRIVDDTSATREPPNYPFEPGMTLVFLGEIPNMPGHCVVAEVGTGRLHVGYHTERFVELREDEA